MDDEIKKIRARWEEDSKELQGGMLFRLFQVLGGYFCLFLFTVVAVETKEWVFLVILAFCWCIFIVQNLDIFRGAI